eukprot:1157993-Pelagomonas_calceolata.AAC.3
MERQFRAKGVRHENAQRGKAVRERCSKPSPPPPPPRAHLHLHMLFMWRSDAVLKGGRLKTPSAAGLSERGAAGLAFGTPLLREREELLLHTSCLCLWELHGCSVRGGAHKPVVCWKECRRTSCMFLLTAPLGGRPVLSPIEGKESQKARSALDLRVVRFGGGLTLGPSEGLEPPEKYIYLRATAGNRDLEMCLCTTYTFLGSKAHILEKEHFG